MPLDPQLRTGRGGERKRVAWFPGCLVALLGTVLALAFIFGLAAQRQSDEISSGTTMIVWFASAGFGLYAASRYRFWIHRIKQYRNKDTGTERI